MQHNKSKIIREREIKFSHNPWTLDDIPISQEETFHITDEDGLHSQNVSRNIFYDCGCSNINAIAGGFCIECVAQGRRGLSCASCYGHCNQCSKPICNGHSNTVIQDNATETRLCNQCFEVMFKPSLIKALINFFLP